MKTAPPVRYVWGLCILRRVDPKSFQGDSISMENSWIPQPFFIHKDDCSVFDTNAKVVPSEMPRLKHIIRFCEHYGVAGHECSYCKVTHE